MRFINLFHVSSEVNYFNVLLIYWVGLKKQSLRKSMNMSGGLNHIFWKIIFSIHGYGKWFLKNCISLLWFEKIILIGYILVSFLQNCMENISVLPKCIVLYYNEQLILILFFLLIDNEFDFKFTLIILNQENHEKCQMFKIVFSIHIVFISIENHPCDPNKEKHYRSKWTY